MSRRTAVRVAVVALVQLVLLGVAVAPRLSAYALGDQYRLRVEAVDPVDPFRGSYVDLQYAGIERPRGWIDRGRVYVPLVRDGGLWRGDGRTTRRPDHAPYLTCESEGWRLRCGIESWFADQDEARRLGERLGRDGGVATVRVDGRGHAVLVGLSAG